MRTKQQVQPITTSTWKSVGDRIPNHFSSLTRSSIWGWCSSLYLNFWPNIFEFSLKGFFFRVVKEVYWMFGAFLVLFSSRLSIVRGVNFFWIKTQPNMLKTCSNNFWNNSWLFRTVENFLITLNFFQVATLRSTLCGEKLQKTQTKTCSKQVCTLLGTFLGVCGFLERFQVSWKFSFSTHQSQLCFF